jgi:hypothetical protein
VQRLVGGLDLGGTDAVEGDVAALAPVHLRGDVHRLCSRSGISVAMNYHAHSSTAETIEMRKPF